MEAQHGKVTITSESNQAASDEQSKPHNLTSSNLSIIREKTEDASTYVTMEGNTSTSKSRKAIYSKPFKPHKSTPSELSIIHEKADDGPTYATMTDQISTTENHHVASGKSSKPGKPTSSELSIIREAENTTYVTMKDQSQIESVYENQNENFPKV
ncbi:unnamed protein product [Clavelina lepadiformis]|uniref:Uncharacterized protein n=1 Tax=Clavelina lepadiformis TaxID=159417 RepID=A0ABP0GH58_CLALP